MNHIYKLHARLLKTGHHNHPLALRRLLLSCAASAPASLSYARSIFDLIAFPDTFAFNTIIRAHADSSPSFSLSLFSKMTMAGVSPDHFTFPFVLKACARLQTGLDLHSLLFKLGFDSDAFEEMPERDLVSWSSMIACFAKNGFGYEALALFQRMQLVGTVKPDEVIVLSVVSAISILGDLELGKWIRGFISRNGLEFTVSLGTALVDMFSRCGCIEESMRVFDEMGERNVLTWTALINGLAVHGRSAEALRMFYEMRNHGFQPDHVTFTGVLVACSHGGLVSEGWHVFESIRNEYGMEPLPEHYGCMVDLLGRAGLLNEACKFVDGMPIRPNSIIWRTLLGACVNHNYIELAEKVKEKINELDSYHDGDYVLLSNVYGGVGDNNHPQFESIREFLVSMIDSLKVVGYTPDISNVLFDIEEEEKESTLGYHSEKLAVAFALLCFKDSRTIRVMKNLRICHDCHCFMKYASDVFEREIIIRDRNRFHHFSKGSCSCRDYW
ncbi:Pentatricopeptide repeat-containing protein [Vitis vinifera]|uniref:Pentatricopeptide repeat-containing protein n=1 Tax=Vitis vinifera TaxID=29760 RepID=A0A438DX07_VITVI|nr:Pentatricopeptide repeat-containing protein [Vitis vinifera]